MKTNENTQAEQSPKNAGVGPAKADQSKCGCGADGMPYHTCPFKEEIYGDAETLCNCCEGCEHECAMDV